MANFYTDHPEIKFNLESNSLMPRIVELKEKGYADKDAFDYAPEDFADAMDNYNRVLEVAGDITANTVFPNSEEVDAEGPHCENGRVRYAAKTYENLEATRKAGLNGVTMPRRFGGLNFPITAYTAINEMIASADAGFENIWSLQDCIETLYEFGDEDQRSRFIPRICAGETMAHLRRRDDVDGLDRTRCRFRPAARDAQGHLQRRGQVLVPERREALHHER